MDEFEKSKRQLLDLLTANIEQETIDYVRHEIRQAAPESVPPANELRAYFQSPDEQTALSAYQQVLAMDKLLEYTISAANHAKVAISRVEKISNIIC